MGMNLIISYDLNLVVLSIFISVLSAYTAIDLTERIATTEGWAGLGWLIGGASSLGIGIWSMHFVGMLAVCLSGSMNSVPITYDVWAVVLSVLPAILAAGLALWIASRKDLQRLGLIGASVLMGLGITTMHYTGMMAMRLPAIAHYNLKLVLLSALIAGVVSLVALGIIRYLRHQTVVIWWQKFGAVILMGLAVPMMHYVGMAAVCFRTIDSFSGEFLVPNTTWLASLTSVGTFSILGLALITSSETKVADRTKELSSALIQLQQSQLQLIQTEKISSLGQLVAGVAHEINNPVNFIHGNIGYIDRYTQNLLEVVQAYQSYYPNPPNGLQAILDDIEIDFLQNDLVKLLHSIKVGTDRIREIVLSLRNFSRLDESDVKAVDVHEGLDNTLMILQHRFNARSERLIIKIVKDYGKLPLVECYPGPLNQVFMNLLVNAIDVLEEAARQNLGDHRMDDSRDIWSGVISISTQVTASNQAQIVISDNGLGISETVRSNMFNPFFTTKPIGQGTGLGLSISHQIITEQHQGQIRCDSRLGVGSRFVVEIPIHQGEHKPR
jgi:signal transduction histidine kinase